MSNIFHNSLIQASSPSTKTWNIIAFLIRNFLHFLFIGYSI